MIHVKKFFPVLLILALMIVGSSAQAVNFADVPEDSWYSAAVKFVTGHGLFHGTSNDTFSPSDTMTRGMFVTALGRFAGAATTPTHTENGGIVEKSGVNLRSEPTTSSNILAVLSANTQVTVLDLNDNWYRVQHKEHIGYIRADLIRMSVRVFADVPQDRYYSSYVRWAQGNGVMDGISPGLFSPETEVTREQICDAMYNYSRLVHYTLPGNFPVPSFTDEGLIDPKYREAVRVLYQAGVITGKDSTRFDPKSGATRAEVAAILSRFVDAVAYKPESEPSFDENGNYIFGTALPAVGDAGNGYFDDALFIGNSFVVGMQTYFKDFNADYRAVSGISVSALLDDYYAFPLTAVEYNENGELVPSLGGIADVLTEKQYGKVYLVFGTNELGSEPYHRDKFSRDLNRMIELARSSQPGAKIYITSVLPISRLRSETSASYNRDNAIAFNNVMKQISREKQVVFLDLFSLLCDSEGFLPMENCLSDGIHILSPQYEQVQSFFRTHAL